MKIVDFQCQVADCRHVVLDKFEDECPAVCPWCGGENTMRRRMSTGRAATTNVDGVPFDLGNGTILTTKEEKAAHLAKVRRQHGDPTLQFVPRDASRERVMSQEAAHQAYTSYMANGDVDRARRVMNRRRRS
jgi:hypothetical protein